MSALEVLHPDGFAAIFNGLVDAPESQMSARLVQQTKEFWERDPKPTDQEQFDFLVILSRTSCCETSSFIKTLCGLDRFYQRPGGPREEPWPTMTVHNTPWES
jgi:hypothetical protein